MQSYHAIELLVKVRELRGLGHDVLVHEERRLHAGEVLLGQHGDGVIDQRLVQQQTDALQEVAAVAGNACAYEHNMRKPTRASMSMLCNCLHT